MTGDVSEYGNNISSGSSVNTHKYDKDRIPEDLQPTYGFLLASVVLDGMSNSSFKEGLKQNLTGMDKFFKNLSKPDNNMVSRNEYLEDLLLSANSGSNDTMKRQPYRGNEGDRMLGQLKKELKRNYIIPWGHSLKLLISSGSAPTTYLAMSNYLRSQVREIMGGNANSLLRHIGAQGVFTEDKMNNEVEAYLKGIRHELAFEEMLLNINYVENQDIFEVEDIGSVTEKVAIQRDLRGIDTVVKAKVLKKELGNNKYEYVFPTEEDNLEKCETATIGVDVKSSPLGAIEAIEKQKNAWGDGRIRPLIIWSFVKDEDFCFYTYWDGEKRRVGKKEEDEAPVYLHSDCLEAMETRSKQVLEQEVSTSRSGWSITRDPIAKRRKALEKIILEYINANPEVLHKD